MTAGDAYPRSEAEEARAFWQWWAGSVLADEGRVVLEASAFDFVEELPPAEPGGKPRRVGHHYGWARCSACGELRLMERAPSAVAKARCLMTPKCRGRLEPAGDAQDFTLEAAVGRAVRAFDAVTVEQEVTP